VTSLRVTIAAYDSLAAATADWEQLGQIPASGLEPLDAVLIERFDRRVTTLHQYWPIGWAQGWLASAIVGRLSPPALLDGALAGGVGRRTLTLVTDGLSPAVATKLTTVLDSRRFVLLAVHDDGETDKAIPSCVGTSTASTAALACTAQELRRVVEADRADE
jgi:hypothetical protein